MPMNLLCWVLSEYISSGSIMMSQHRYEQAVCFEQFGHQGITSSKMNTVSMNTI